MNKILKLSTIGLCLFTSGCSFFQNNQSTPVRVIPVQTVPVTPTENIPSTYNYMNKEKGFSLQIPSAWTFQETVFNSIVVLFAPIGSGDTIKENIGITSVDISGDINLDTYYYQTTSMLENIITDYKLIGKETIQINNITGMVIVYQGTDHDQKLKRQQVFFPIGKTMYVLTYTATQDTFDTLLQDANNIINSFKI